MGQEGVAGWCGATKILEFQNFSWKVPLLKSGAGHFLFNATFWFEAPLGPQGYPRAQLGWKSKVKIGLFFIESVSP